MALRIENGRPKYFHNPTEYVKNASGYEESVEGDEVPVIGLDGKLDYLFFHGGELEGKKISQVNLIRAINPGMSLKAAKDAVEHYLAWHY